MIRLFPSRLSASRLVFIMAGQSNMVGQGSLSQVPTYARANRCFIYRYNEQWAAGAEPMSDHTGIVYTVFNDDENLASCGMAFADSLAGLRSGVEIGLVPCAKGGSGMTSWVRNESTSSLYGAMLARVRAALQLPGTALGGLVWYQGEEDSRTSSAANAWRSRFETFVANVRSDFDSPGLPVIHTKLGPDPNLSERPYWENVQDQQEAVSIPVNDMVSAEDLSTLSDDIHLNTPSLVTLGGRYATAMNHLLN